MKLFLLLLTSSFAQDDYNDDISLEPEKIILNLNIYPTIENCYNKTNQTVLAITFDTDNQCNCYNKKKQISCFQELIHGYEYNQYNWSQRLANQNISNININRCIISQGILPNECFICDNKTLDMNISVPIDRCVGNYFIGIILGLLVIILLISCIYVCINYHKYDSYENLTNTFQKKIIFFKK